MEKQNPSNCRQMLGWQPLQLQPWTSLFSEQFWVLPVCFKQTAGLLSSCCVITGRTCMLPEWHWCFWLLAIFPIPLHQPWHLFSVTACLPVTKRAKLHSMVTGLYGFVTIQSMESPAPEKVNIFCLGKGGFTGTKMEQNFHHLCILPTDKSQKSPWDRNFYLT